MEFRICYGMCFDRLYITLCTCFTLQGKSFDTYFRLVASESGIILDSENMYIAVRYAGDFKVDSIL